MPNLTVSANIDTFMGSADNATARTNLSAAKSGANTDLTSVALTTGTITTAPGSANDIVNKTYADSIGSGVNFHDACDYGTIAVLSPAATYNQPGGAGVGVNATLTGGTNVALVIDGITVATGKRILVKNQASTFQNGIYNVTQQGDNATVPYILTRASDYDTSGSAPNEVQAGDFVIVLNSTLANTAWVQQSPAPINFGVTAITFIQFAAANAGVTSFNTSLSGLTPSTNSTGAVTLAGTLAVASGGTGQTAYMDGQLLIGNTATGGLSKTTLTAGTNVTITNGPGTITLAATGGTATIVQTFTSSGTWTKPAGAVAVDVVVISAGGGGGSGRKAGVATAASSGGGGGGGSYSMRNISAALLGVIETVTVGIGGTGGASVTANSTNGNIGVTGGNSSFGTWIQVTGGGGAGAATTTSGPAGAGSSSRAMFQGSNGSVGGTGAGVLTGGSNASVSGAGGGAGGGLPAAATVGFTGSTGGTCLGSWFSGGTANGGTIGGNGGSAPSVTVGFAASSSAGGGGGSSVTSNAGNGGNGGTYGGAGGGGGAALDSVGNSGAGGNGADGIVVVTTYF